LGKRKGPVRQFHGIVQDVGVGGEQVLVPVIVEIEIPTPHAVERLVRTLSPRAADILKLTIP